MIIEMKNYHSIKDQALMIDVVSDLNVFSSMETEWNDILSLSQLNNPFLTFEWLNAWWKGYGAGHQLFLLRLKYENKLIGWAPLMQYKTKLTGVPVQAIGFVGNHWMGMDFIFLPEYREMGVKHLTHYLVDLKKPVILSYFNEGSQNQERLLTELQHSGIQYALTQKASPYIRQEGEWEDYLKTRTHRFRREYKKKKEAAQAQGKFILQRVRGAFDIGDVLNEIMEVSKDSWQGKQQVAIVSSEDGRGFYQELMSAWTRKNYIEVSLLKLNNETIAYIVGFMINKHFYVFDTGFKEKHKDLSAGMLIHNMLLEEMHQECFDIFDFGYVADYKKRWTDTAMTISDLTIFPKGLKGSILVLGYKIKMMKQQKEMSEKKEEQHDQKHTSIS